MPTTIPSAALVPLAPVFSSTERPALAGFLAGYRGLTRQAYELDLRQYASWCQQHQLRLFGARRADFELFARDLEARGRARATITRACAKAACGSPEATTAIPGWSCRTTWRGSQLRCMQAERRPYGCTAGGSKIGLMAGQVIRHTAAVIREDDWYVARALEVEVASQGRTIDEALANLREALELYFEDEPVPEATEAIVAPIEVQLSA